jgi:chromate transporter
LPALERVLVFDRMWIDSSAFLNAVAYGNLTPGPIVIASTYMGFKISGFMGALAATVGIFCGPIVLMIVLFPFLNRVLKVTVVDWALAGLLPAVVGSLLGILPGLYNNLPKHNVLFVLPPLIVWASLKTKWPSWALMLASGAAAALLI